MIVLDMYPKSSAEGKLNFPDEALINQIFEVTHIGMTSVIPSNFSKEEGYKLWRETYDRRIRTGTTYILIFDESGLKGYLAYNLRFDKEDIYLEDLIILPKYQNDGRTAARLVCAFLNEIENSNLSIIRTYTNKLNKRMQGILSKAGFSVDEFTEKGIKYITTKEQLMKRYSNLMLYFHKKKREN
jgi:hypothetical protein